MPRPTATTSTAAAAAAAAFPSLPKLSKWLPKLGLPRRRRHLTRPCRASPSRSPSLPGINAASCSGGGDRGTCGFSEVFRRFDADGDGKISGAELLSFLTSAGEVGVSPEDVERVVGELDSDGDGLMDYGDFVRLMGRGGGGGGGEGGEVDREEEKDHEDLRAAFEMFVAEKGAGCITPEGLRRALGRLGEQKSQEECAAMIRAFDADGNGVLDYQEFCRMMTT